MTTFRSVCRGSLLALSLGLSAGLAQANLLVNGSFENTANSYVPGANGAMTVNAAADAIPGWSFYSTGSAGSNSLAWLTAPLFGMSPSNGAMLLDLTGSFDQSFSGIRQSVATQAGARYHLAFDLGAANAPSCPGFDCSGPVAVTVAIDALVSQAIGNYDPVDAGMQWQTFGFDFVARAESTLLGIHGLNAGGSVQFLGLDNAVLTLTDLPPTTPVPEPGTWALMAAGLGAVAWRRRRASATCEKAKEWT